MELKMHCVFLLVLMVQSKHIFAFHISSNESKVIYEDEPNDMPSELVTQIPVPNVTSDVIVDVSSLDDDEMVENANPNNTVILLANEIPNLPKFEPRNLPKEDNELVSKPINSESSTASSIELNQTDMAEFPNNMSFYSDACQFCPEIRFLQHYLSKGCIAMDLQEECKPKFCPKYFNCPEEKELPKDGCMYNNTFYKFGENVPSHDLCQDCVCINSTNGPTLSCAINECFNAWHDIGPNCYRKYTESQCCPEVVCLPANQSLPTCNFEGSVYHFGDYFSPQDDPCYNCLCNEQWNNTESTLENSCHRIECTFDHDRPEHKGCAPVYSDKSCCPIYYHCPDTSSNNNEPKCNFGDNLYEIGEKIKLKQREVCLECSCLVPPEISCKHRSCPVVPTNCTASYTEGECCPLIKCNITSRTEVLLNMPIESTDEDNEQERQMKKCPPIDTCEDPCKLILPIEDEMREKEMKCPECRCDPNESPSKMEVVEEVIQNKTYPMLCYDKTQPCGANSEKVVTQLANTKNNTDQMNSTKLVRLAKFQKFLLERRGKRCPDIPCEYPCYIYQVSSGDCPKCSCASKEDDTQRRQFLASSSLLIGNSDKNN